MFFGYPATEKVIAVTHTAAAVVFGTSEIFWSTQSGERGDQLESRARRQCTDRAVHERIAFVLLQYFPILGFDARNECVWIERRHRGHGQNVAVVRIENDCARAANRTQRFFGDRLNACIQGEINVAALLWRVLMQDTVDLPLGVTPQTTHAW